MIPTRKKPQRLRESVVSEKPKSEISRYRYKVIITSLKSDILLSRGSIKGRPLINKSYVVIVRVTSAMIWKAGWSRRQTKTVIVRLHLTRIRVFQYLPTALAVLSPWNRVEYDSINFSSNPLWTSLYLRDISLFKAPITMLSPTIIIKERLLHMTLVTFEN